MLFAPVQVRAVERLEGGFMAGVENRAPNGVAPWVGEGVQDPHVTRRVRRGEIFFGPDWEVFAADWAIEQIGRADPVVNRGFLGTAVA